MIGPKSNQGESQRSRQDVNIQFLFTKRKMWVEYLRKQLRTLYREKGIRIEGEQRKNSDRRNISSNWNELKNSLATNWTQADGNSRLYTAKDFLNMILGKQLMGQGFYNLGLSLAQPKEICVRYAQTLRAKMPRQSEVERLFTLKGEQSLEQCLSILRGAYTQAAWRGELWTRALISQPPLDWIRLCSLVGERSGVWDKLLVNDVHKHAANNGEFFVFENQVQQLVLCLVRDPEVHQELKRIHDITEELPSIVPFAGFCRYAAPFSYIFEYSNQKYFTFRGMYLKYLHLLGCIDDNPESIVSLSLLFKRLMIQLEPELYQYMMAHGIYPLRLVFKWIMRAFSGYLHSTQLMLLWDLILGYDSLNILPLLAVSVLSYYKSSLMLITTPKTASKIVADLRTLSLRMLLEIHTKHYLNADIKCDQTNKVHNM